MASAQTGMARERLIAEGFGIDRNKAEHSASVNRISEGLSILGKVAGSGKSTLGGIKDALGVAVGGTQYLKEHAFTLHLVVEQDNETELNRAMSRVRDLARKASGVELPDSVPRVMRSRPFGPVRGMLGRDGERWVPIHAVFPLGDAQEVLAANRAFFEQQQPMMSQHGIVYSVMTMTTGHEFFLEPAFYWMDEITPLHAASVGEEVVKPWRDRPANVEAREAVARLRRGTQELYASLGGVSWQVARDYPFLEILKPETRALLESVKRAVDPAGLMNPGSLGLAR
jgi:D-lactate dehydrogenase (cytochrome)